jgi:hypothetical protein
MLIAHKTLVIIFYWILPITAPNRYQILKRIVKSSRRGFIVSILGTGDTDISSQYKRLLFDYFLLYKDCVPLEIEIVDTACPPMK